MASAVETQRLISLSLGKIARSRAQRGGINLHKNLLVASVLNKARTAFMMENYSYQFAQQQQQRSQQIILSAPQPVLVNNSHQQSENCVRDECSSSPSSEGSTCQTTPHTESRSTVPLPDTLDASSEPECDNTPQEIVVVQHTIENNNNLAPASDRCIDKENISPAPSYLSPTEEESNSDSTTVLPSQSQCCVSDEHHLEAANQLSQNAQSAGNTTVCNNDTTLTYTTLSSCKQENLQPTSGTTTCSGILKRRRENLDANLSPYSESDYPASKKLCTLSSSPDCSYYNSESYELTSSHPLRDGDSSDSEYESDYEKSEPMQTSESPQITNLVTIFNSGFSGLCMSPSSSSPLEYTHSYQPTDNESSTHSLSSPGLGINHHWSNSSRNSSSSTDSNQSSSLSCSSLVDRIGSISSAIVLSA